MPNFRPKEYEHLRDCRRGDGKFAGPQRTVRKESNMTHRDRHVVPHDNGWAVRREERSAQAPSPARRGRPSTMRATSPSAGAAKSSSTTRTARSSRSAATGTTRSYRAVEPARPTQTEAFPGDGGTYAYKLVAVFLR